PTIISVSVPPVWKAMSGSKESPIMMQKIVSEPKPHARNTVSNATRRISSTTAIPSASCSKGVLENVPKQLLSNPLTTTIHIRVRKRRSQANPKEGADRRQCQDGCAGEPDEQRRFRRIILGADEALVDRCWDASKDDARCRQHQGREIKE